MKIRLFQERMQYLLLIKATDITVIIEKFSACAAKLLSYSWVKHLQYDWFYLLFANGTLSQLDLIMQKNYYYFLYVTEYVIVTLTYHGLFPKKTQWDANNSMQSEIIYIKYELLTLLTHWWFQQSCLISPITIEYHQTW